MLYILIGCMHCLQLIIFKLGYMAMHASMCRSRKISTVFYNMIRKRINGNYDPLLIFFLLDKKKDELRVVFRLLSWDSLKANETSL